MAEERGAGDDAVESVVRALQEGKTLTAASKEVASDMDLSPAAVRSRVYRAKVERPKDHGHRKLTRTQELVVLVLLLAHSEQKLAIPAADVNKMVQDTWGISVGKNFGYRFLERHSEYLRPRKTKLLGKARTWEATEEQVNDWIAGLKSARVTFHMVAHTKLNYDETCMYADLEGHVCVESASKLRANRSGLKSRVLCSMVPFVLANGKVLLVVYILPAKFGDDEDCEMDTPFPAERYPHRATESTPSSYERFYAYTATGYMNAALFRKVIDKFVEVWQLYNPGLECFVFGDQLASHINRDVTATAMGKGVYLWLLPSNSSHFLQVLDSYIFATLKNTLRSEMRKILRVVNFTSFSEKGLLFSAMYRSERVAFRSNVVEAAWRDTGMHPFDEERIRQLMHENLGTFDSGEPASESRQAHIVRVATEKCREVLQATQTEAARASSSVTVRTTRVSRNGLYSPVELVRHHEELREEKEARAETARAKKRKREEDAAERKETKRKHTCSARCSKVWRGGQQWVHCSKCEQVLFCPTHKAQLSCHERVCRGKRRRRC